MDESAARYPDLSTRTCAACSRAACTPWSESGTIEVDETRPELPPSEELPGTATSETGEEKAMIFKRLVALILCLLLVLGAADHLDPRAADRRPRGPAGVSYS